MLDPGGLEVGALPTDLVAVHALRVPAGAQRDRERFLRAVAPDAFDDGRRALSGFNPIAW